MCYMLYLSTDSPWDLTEFNSELLRFERLEDDEGEGTLRNPRKWYVGSKAGCSCTFRHLVSIELGFGEPVTWAPEEEDEIQATAALYRVIVQLRSEGYKVDLLDLWEGEQMSEIPSLVVDLGAISVHEFRLFENHHFIFDQD
jgi:hypothetical protein